MADNMIELVASLNINDSAKQINETDIPLLKDQIEAIKIKCELDTDGISSIQSQLANISKNSKLDIPKVEVQTDTRQSAQNIENVAKSVETTTNKVLTLKKTLADLDSRFVEAFKAVENPDGIINAERTMAVIQSRLSSLGTVTVTGKYNDQESEDSINKIIARIEAASGEVRELNFLLDSTGQKFEYIGGSYSDKGVGKIQQDLARLSKELANFEASHKSIESGLIEPLTTARNAIIDLESGIGSVESAQKALDNLKTIAANIGSNLKSTGSSFNVFDNAANKAKNFDNIIKTLKMDIESLSPSTSKSSLVSQLDLAIERMNEFRDVESKFGRGVEWSQRYGEISSLLQNITNNLKVAQKEENAFNKEFEQAVRSEEKQLAVEQKRVEVARQLRESQQHDYWQGRFEESVKGMTAENQVLKDMKKYYEDLNKAQKEVERQEKKTFQEDNKLANFQNRIKRLTADINSYAAANKRAVESTKKMSSGKSFVDEWARITSTMAKGAELTDREFKDLSTDIAVFKKEAKSAGLEGASAFEKFGNAFKTISTYISANQIINMVISQIRLAVTELQTVDDRLTEISKTSDRTVESLRSLGETAFDTASKYGRTASDYLLGVQEMSRAGFNEQQSEAMAELTILAQAAGDMTADLANQYLIATNAAYDYNGSIAELTDTLDRQNYVTNHYALSMNDLAEATKIAASQAAQSGIGIDKMTAALSTMIATTQQGGEIAARSLRGILMNIQQVKGEVGDGEEDITSESLTKYEKAAEALGVSLKEVRNGAVSLRDPMVVLDELATAFNKEADDSIKKANLISAIGGKYRGNQLSALLSNWDTYKDILNTFNSEQAVGSAMTEAEKSANNWAGSLNKVRNSWAELVNQFINSDNAVSVIQSINRMIQSLTESAATGGLKTTANLLSDLVELILVFSEKVGALPVLLAGIAGIGSFKGKGIFGTITDEIDKSVKHITIFKKQWADIKTDISNPNTKGLSKVGVALEGVKIKAIATEVAVSALNAALTLGLSLAVGLAVKGISKLVDNLVVTKEELAEMRQETLNDLDSLSDSITSLTEDSQTLQGLLSQYKQLSQSTQDISQNKEELLRIQDTLVEQFGDEANNLDLLNDKYDTTIEKIKDLSEAQQTEWRRQHAAEIKRAEDIASLDVNIGSGLTNPVATNRGFVDATNDLVKQLYVMDGLNREFTEYATSLDDVYYVYRSFWGKDDKIALTGTIEEAREQLGQLIDTYKNMDNVDQATLGALTTRYEELGRAIEDVNTYTEQNNLQNNIANVGNSIGNISKTALTSLSEIQTETDNIGNKWFENLDEAQKGSLKTINTVTSALQKIAGGDLLSGDEFWALAKIDTERVLDGAKLVGNQFKVSEEQLIQLKDTYIKKQIETIKAENADLAVKKQQTDELIRQAELEVQALGRRGLSNSAYRTEFEKANAQLRQSKQYSKEYGDSITRNNILIQQLNGSLGNTIDYQKALSDRQKKLNDEISRLNKEADNLLKAQEYVIDQRIKDNENEKKALEDEKKLLEEQLDVLEQQQSELEDMIENYKSIAGVVEDELGKSIENLKKQQEAEENAVQAKIDALKESRERQDEENSLLEKELKLKEKLANLDKAKSTKVRTFSSARGWHFDVDREAVANAEEEVRAAQKSYDDAVADKAYKDQEKALEQEKDAIAKNYEVEIKAYEDYIQQYKDVLEEETVAENERLAEQILGADWREKISKRDIELLGKFRSEYGRHNAALKNLTNTEIAMTKASIEAKDAEIKAKQEQIDAWNQYKTDVQQAAQDIKNANEDYMNYINGVILPNEANNFVQREINLWNFKENYKAYMDEIASKQAELDSVADSLTNLQDIANGFDLGDLISNLERMTDQFGNALLTVDEFEKMWEDTYEKQKRMGIINSASAAYVMGSHSEGGVADYTGLAMLHGTKQKSETIFNANDSAKLYDMIHNTPNLMADMVSKAVKISRPTIANNSTTNNPIFNIQRMEINGVQNPKEFTEAFNKNIEAYWKTKLTENRVK